MEFWVGNWSYDRFQCGYDLNHPSTPQATYLCHYTPRYGTHIPYNGMPYGILCRAPSGCTRPRQQPCQFISEVSAISKRPASRSMPSQSRSIHIWTCQVCHEVAGLNHLDCSAEIHHCQTQAGRVWRLITVTSFPIKPVETTQPFPNRFFFLVKVQVSGLTE